MTKTEAARGLIITGGITIMMSLIAGGAYLYSTHPKVTKTEPVDAGYEQITKYTYRVIDRELGNVCYRTAVSGGAISCVPMRNQ